MIVSEKSPELKFATYIYYVILYLFVTGMFERSLEKMFALKEEIKQKQDVMDRKLDTLLQEREDGAGADAYIWEA